MKWPLHRVEPNIPENSLASFGASRTFYQHSGIDLYCPGNTYVVSCESGRVINISEFTGPFAAIPTPWWNRTRSILIEGESGVLGYCELEPSRFLQIGSVVAEGEFLGTIIPVLKQDKGNGTTMLHFEKYSSGIVSHMDWVAGQTVPEGLEDPTEFLRKVMKDVY